MLYDGVMARCPRCGHRRDPLTEAAAQVVGCVEAARRTTNPEELAGYRRALARALARVREEAAVLEAEMAALSSGRAGRVVGGGRRPEEFRAPAPRRDPPPEEFRALVRDWPRSLRATPAERRTRRRPVAMGVDGREPWPVPPPDAWRELGTRIAREEDARRRGRPSFVRERRPGHGPWCVCAECCAWLEGAASGHDDVDSQDANERGADVDGADVDGADVDGADVDGADVDGADVDGADGDDG
jgi:hypothetical protein